MWPAIVRTFLVVRPGTGQLHRTLFGGGLDLLDDFDL